MVSYQRLNRARSRRPMGSLTTEMAMVIMTTTEMGAEDQEVVLEEARLLAEIIRGHLATATPMVMLRAADITTILATRAAETAAEGVLSTVTIAKEGDATAAHIAMETGTPME